MTDLEQAHVSQRKIVFVGLVFALLFFVCTLSPPAQSPPPPMAQRISAALAVLDDPEDSQLTMSNLGSTSLVVTVGIYSLRGDAIPAKAVMLGPHELRLFQISDLLESDVHTPLGSISLSYTGAAMQLAAQITLLHVGGHGSVDVPFSDDMQTSSNRQDAVWWVPGTAKSVIALSNTSDQRVQGTIAFSDGANREFDLKPHATALVESPGFHETVASASVDYVGSPGAILEVGFVTSSSGYTSSIRFYDPKAVQQPNLYATDLPLAENTPHLVLRNLSDKSLLATPLFVSANNELNRVQLPKLEIRGGTVVALDLSDLVQRTKNDKDFDRVSVQIQSTGRSGDLIGALTALDNENNLTYDVPLRDSGPRLNSSGSYPLRWDSDYSSVVSVTNTSETPLQFVSNLWIGNKPYYLPTQTLEPGQTALFDTHALKESTQKDVSGHLVPSDATKTGKYHWIMTNSNVGRLIGRDQITSVQDRVASSFSCGDCGYSWDGPYVSLSSNSVAVGDTITWSSTCNNCLTVPNFTNQTTSICSVSGNSITGISAGTCTLSYTYYTDQFTWDGSRCLEDYHSSTNYVSVPVQAYAQISSMTLDPSTINLHSAPNTSSITVQVFHTDLTSVGAQTVTVTVGTYSSNPPPPSLTVAYNPATLPLVLSGGQGVATATLGVSSQNGSGTVVIQAVLSQPSGGITIKDPSPTNSQKTLTITPN